MMELKYGRTGRIVQLAELQHYVGPGWSGIIERLINDLIPLGWDGVILQVKEKFGALRIYPGAASEEIRARINQAANESLQICEKCGQPGELREDRDWLKTMCEDHKDVKVWDD